MNNNQAAWASQHDWFVDSQVVDGDIVVEVSTIVVMEDEQGQYAVEQCGYFSNYQELRAWAGY